VFTNRLLDCFESPQFPYAHFDNALSGHNLPPLSRGKL
jgi:hypothetical protein